MADNGTRRVLVVDGSVNGYQIALNVARGAMLQIGDPVFRGRRSCDFLDSFRSSINPGHRSGGRRFRAKWYSTRSMSRQDGGPDNIITIVAIEREVWIFGRTRVKSGSTPGRSRFRFRSCQTSSSSRMPPQNIPSPRWMPTSIGLRGAPEGNGMVIAGKCHRTSPSASRLTPSKRIQSYPRIDDAIGATYHGQWHCPFYKLHFPTADDLGL